MLKAYVKQEFYGLVEKEWSDSMVEKFIIQSIEKDTSVNELINDIDYEGLEELLGDRNVDAVMIEVLNIMAVQIINAKEQIRILIGDIDEDLEGFDQEEENQMEIYSLDNQRLM